VHQLENKKTLVIRSLSKGTHNIFNVRYVLVHKCFVTLRFLLINLIKRRFANFNGEAGGGGGDGL
jgi:hypothetical protein